MTRHCVLLCMASLALVCIVKHSAACNEAICASLVSKCMLLKSCECNMMDMKNCTCCKDCHKCLAKLYTECCDCVGMCPEKSLKESEKMSSVEELQEPIPELFGVLTEEEDPHRRWSVYTYPAHLDLLYFQPHGNEVEIGTGNNPGSKKGHHIRHENHHIVDPGTSFTNCSVAYMSQCMSLNKCKMSCQSMGAARYRWFHQHGCCECIGSTCLDYGKGEALCLKCPLPDGEEEDILVPSQEEELDQDDEDEEGGDKERGADDDEEEEEEGEWEEEEEYSEEHNTDEIES